MRVLQTYSSPGPTRNTVALEACIVMANGQAGGEQAKDQERLRARLVLDIILDRVWDEVLVLEIDLRTQDATFLMTGHRADLRHKLLECLEYDQLPAG